MADDEIGLEDVIDMRKNPSTIAADLSEKERIQLLRNEGSEVQKKGLESIFGGNKWKPQKNREKMWAKKLDEGRKPVRELIRSYLREKGKEVTSPFNQVSNQVKKGRKNRSRSSVRDEPGEKAEQGSVKADVEPDERGMTTLDQFG